MKKTFCFIFTFIFFSAQSQSLWTIYNTSNSSLPDNVIRVIETDTAGNVWVGTDNGLAKFDGSNWTVIDSSNSGLPVNQIRSIAFDSANRLWVGTLQAGFSVYDGSNWTNFSSTNSLLPDDQVRSIAFDADKIAWIGTTGGVAYLSDEGWIIYDMFNSPLGANNINKIFIDANDTKWIGTVNGGISKKEGNAWTIYDNHNSGLTDNTVTDLENDIFGNLWFATPAQGLGRFNGANWYYRVDANSNIPTNSITCVEIVKNTDVKYMGTSDKGLVRWNNGLEFDSFTVNNSPIPDNRVNCLKRTTDGKIWIGTSTGGVAVFNDTTNFAIVNTINEVTATDAFQIYPNPVREKLNVLGSQFAVCKLEISNLLGEVMLQKPEVGNLKWEVDVSSFPNGLYIVRMSGDGLALTKKFLKQ